MLRRAFSSLGCPEFTLDAAFALAEKHRLDGFELRALGGTIELPGYFAAQFGSPAALAEKLGAAAGKILALDTSLKLIGSTPAEWAGFLEFLPWAEALGVPRLRVFDGGRGLSEDALAEAAETVRTIRWRTRMRSGGSRSRRPAARCCGIRTTRGSRAAKIRS